MKKKLQITDFRVKRAIVLYKSGKAIKPICKQLHMDGQTLRKLLIVGGILRTRGEAVRGGKSNAVVNDAVLDIFTSEALYWIGFLYADGHIEKDRPRVALTLSEVDKHHLRKFGEFFGENLVIRKAEGRVMKNNGYVSNPTFRVAFSSKKIYQKLVDMGFTHRKTYEIIPNDVLINSRDFWRGVVDGDGWVINGKVIGVGLSGSELTIKEFLYFIRKSGIETATSPLKSTRSDHLWSCELHSHKAVSVLKLLYENATVHLDRKYQKYLEIKEKS